MFYVYLLRSKKDQSYYIGQTEDVDARLQRHNNGYVSSTRRRVPWVLVGFETYPTRSAARWREFELKNSSVKRREFIKNVRIGPHSSTDRA
ncbi:MAG: GIY-YIG nuclease family protein [Patescibacteria group bacterium]